MLVRNQMKRVLGICVFLIQFHFSTSAQVASGRRLIEDKPSLDTMAKAIFQLYNGKFNEADLTVNSLRKKYDNHPAISLFSALQRYWRHMPVQKSPKDLEAYKVLLYRTASLSEVQLKRNSKNPEAIFFNMLSYLMLARLNAETGEYIKAVNDARKAYSQILIGKSLKDKYPEFYFSTGLFNYYREYYPLANPVYKPFAFFFESGNMPKGLEELEVAAYKSIFCKAEALTFLTFIHLRYEDNLPEALRFSKKLVDEFPGNNVFKLLRTEVLLKNGNYIEAEGLIAHLLNQSSSFLFAPSLAFHGVLYEKYYAKFELAKGFYLKSLQFSKPTKRTEDTYSFMCYAGLARIYRLENNIERAKYYFKKVEDSPISRDKEEARKFLNSK